MLELAVLGLLAEQPLHGYELKKRLGETLGPLWGISFGNGGAAGPTNSLYFAAGPADESHGLFGAITANG